MELREQDGLKKNNWRISDLQIYGKEKENKNTLLVPFICQSARLYQTPSTNIDKLFLRRIWANCCFDIAKFRNNYDINDYTKLL